MLNKVQVHTLQPLLYHFVEHFRIHASQPGKQRKMFVRGERWVKVVILLAYSNKLPNFVGIVADRGPENCNVTGSGTNFAG